MINPRQFAPYVGFTEEEVIELCQEYEMDFKEAAFGTETNIELNIDDTFTFLNEDTSGNIFRSVTESKKCLVCILYFFEQFLFNLSS